MQRKIRVGLVGIGGYGGQHLSMLRTLEQFDMCELVAVADPFVARHEGTTGALRAENVSVSLDPTELLRRTDIEAVFIASPIHRHAPQAIAALESSKHVYLEKPPCATLGEFERINVARVASGKLCVVGFQMQTSPAMRFLKTRLLDGAIGTLQSVRAVVRARRDAAYYHRTPWAGRWRVETEDGPQPVFDGPATNALAHVGHGALFLAGPTLGSWPTLNRVRGSLRKAHPIESYDSSYLEAETTDAVRVQTAFTHATAASGDTVIRCEGSEGHAEVNWDGTVVLTPQDRNAQTYFFAFQPALAAPLDFLRALQPASQDTGGGQLVSSLQDTLPFMQMVSGGLQSSGGASRFAAPIELVGDPSDGTYQVAGFDEQLEAFRTDGTALPPLFGVERNPWLTPADLAPDWLPDV